MFNIKFSFNKNNKLFNKNFLFDKLYVILKNQIYNDKMVFKQKYNFFFINSIFFFNKNIIQQMLLYHIKNNNKITQLVTKIKDNEISLGFLILNSDSNLEIDKITNYYILNKKNDYFIIKTNLDLIKLQKQIFKNNCLYHINNDVNILDINNTYIDNNVIIKKNTIIYPGSIINNNTIIGENNVIGPNSIINNSIIGNNCKINNSCIYSSNIKNNVQIGPYSHIRPNCEINNNIKIGNFVEIKKSNINSGTKISHLTYIGDANIGKNVNFGCGCITVNYDGINKYLTNISDNVFIGCNVNLIAPLNIGSNVYIAAGTTVTKNIDNNTFSIGRVHQINKKILKLKT